MIYKDLRHYHLEDVVRLALLMNDESPVYSKQTVDPYHSLDYLRAAWNAGVLFGAMCHDYMGEAQGVMFGSVSAPWTTPVPQASEWMLYVTPKNRGGGHAVKLIRMFTDMARQRGAQKLYVGSTTGINDEGVRKLYERLGFNSTGSSLVKEL